MLRNQSRRPDVFQTRQRRGSVEGVGLRTPVISRSLRCFYCRVNSGGNFHMYIYIVFGNVWHNNKLRIKTLPFGGVGRGGGGEPCISIPRN